MIHQNGKTLEDFPPPFQLPPGTTLGNYRIIDQLGSGYEGTVFRAVEIPTGIRRALKCMHYETEEDTARIVHIAQTYQALSHTGAIARYHHLGHAFTDNGHTGIYFLVLDLLRGETLLNYVEAIRGDARERDTKVLLLILALAGQINSFHKAGYAVGDFESAVNTIVSEPDGELIFCDFDTGSPGFPNRHWKNDFKEFFRLTEWIFSAIRTRRSWKKLKPLFETYKTKRFRRDTFGRFYGELFFQIDALTR